MEKSKKINIDNFLFLFAFFLIEFSVFATNIVYINKLSKLITDISLGIFLIDAIIVSMKLKFNYRKLFLIFCLIASSFFIYIQTDDSLILQLCLTLVCSLNKKFDEIVKKDLIFKVFVFLAIFMAYCTGNVRNDYFVRAGEIRNALGFRHPNSLGFFIMMSYFEFIYLYRNKLRYLTVVIIGIISFILISIANSRSAEISIIIFIILFTIFYILNKIKKNKNKKINWTNILIQNLFPLFIIISFIITNMYDDRVKWVHDLDKLFSGRVYIQSLYLKSYKISFLGNAIDYFMTLDNAYLRCILSLGIIGTLIYLYIYNRVIFWAQKNKDNLLKIIILVLLVYGMMEWYIIRPTLNVFLIYASTYFLSKTKNKENEDE